MKEYWVNDPGTIGRTVDSAFIPPDLGNRDYVAYLAWTKGGNIAATLSEQLADLAILNVSEVTLVS